MRNESLNWYSILFKDHFCEKQPSSALSFEKKTPFPTAIFQGPQAISHQDQLHASLTCEAARGKVIGRDLRGHSVTAVVVEGSHPQWRNLGKTREIDGNWWKSMEIDGNCNLILAHYQEISMEMSYESMKL